MMLAKSTLKTIDFLLKYFHANITCSSVPNLIMILKKYIFFFGLQFRFLSYSSIPFEFTVFYGCLIHTIYLLIFNIF
jgi:hypothetical protein